jgi:hypothetical protein
MGPGFGVLMRVALPMILVLMGASAGCRPIIRGEPCDLNGGAVAERVVVEPARCRVQLLNAGDRTFDGVADFGNDAFLLRDPVAGGDPAPSVPLVLRADARAELEVVSLDSWPSEVSDVLVFVQNQERYGSVSIRGGPEVCDDGEDNDDDGLVDCDDAPCPACGSGGDETCDDEVDNDDDRLVDCADPDCFDGCPGHEDCDNSADDDSDASVDCDDPDCFNGCPGHEDCDNGLDDNGNGDIDCEDYECWFPGLWCPEDCENGRDDDGDLLVDCFDESDCPGGCGSG